MDKIARIRQEIERNRQAIRVLNEHTAPEQMSKTCAIFQYSDSILSGLNSFIDTLSEEPDKSLEEAADKYAQMMDEWLKDRDGCFWDGVEEGKKEMKDALMEWAKGRREAVAKEVVIQEGVRLGADAAFEELIDKLNEM